jgi:hypothetical protein
MVHAPMKTFFLATTGFLAFAPLHADPPAKIDLGAMPAHAQVIDDVVVPVPSEIFNVLDKLGKPNWAQVLRPTRDSVKVPNEPVQIALQLGAVIAEGFIAVEAENPEEVKKIGGNVRKLATALGVARQVNKRADAIIDESNQRNWSAVRKELDSAMRDVKAAMIDLNSEPLSQLISLGGWIRGTEALTDVVSAAFSKDGAELLHQPVLLDYFDRKLSTMPDKYKNTSIIGELQQGVTSIRPLVGIEDGTQISEKSVKEVGETARRLMKTIDTRSN